MVLTFDQIMFDFGLKYGFFLAGLGDLEREKRRMRYLVLR